MFSIIFEIFRTFPMILMIISFMDFLLYKSLYSLWLCIGLLLNGLIWEISTKYISLKWPSLEDRPNRYHCAYYESDEPITSSGLPSGHCQSMAFFVMWVILIIWYNQGEININIIISIIIGVYLIYMMMYSRVMYYRCHTWLQAIIGSFIGILTAIIMWFSLRYLNLLNN